MTLIAVPSSEDLRSRREKCDAPLGDMAADHNGPLGGDRSILLCSFEPEQAQAKTPSGAGRRTASAIAVTASSKLSP